MESGSGWMVAGGYFYKDRIFGNHAIGGPHLNFGHVFQLPYRFGIWAGGGVLKASGAFNAKADDGSGFRMDFESDVYYADLGVQMPWVPLPLCVAFYHHSTRLSARGTSGSTAGLTLTGADESSGIGFTIHVILEYFFSSRERPPRGLGLVGGYIGMMEGRGRDIPVGDGAGHARIFKGWKPFKGESLRLGLEYEF